MADAILMGQNGGGTGDVGFVGKYLGAYDKLLLHMNGTSGSTTFTDSATSKTVSSNGSAQITTAQYKFGGASGYFNGTSSYLYCADDADWNFWNNDFTLDFWANFSSLPVNGGSSFNLLSQMESPGTGAYWAMDITNSSGIYKLGFYNAVTLPYTLYTVSITTGTWYHFAVSRSNNTLYLFLNGTLLGSHSVTATTLDISAPMTIGCMILSGTAQRFFNGYLDELRISKGIARWTSNFTPPTSEYATSGPITLATIKSGDYIYANEDTSLELTTQTQTTIDHSTPVTVVGSAYDVSGNGGRKLTRLSNGWLVSAMAGQSPVNSNKSVLIYYSTDNGATWNRLCWREYDVSTGTDIAGRFAMASNGTTVTLIYVAGTTGIYSITFNATTVTNAEQGSLQKTVDSGQTAMGGGASLTIDSSGILHAAWASKNSIYGNSYNIRYSKSVDSGSTWASPTQVTNGNSSGTDLTNPCIVMKDSYPHIIGQYKDSSQYIVFDRRFNGSSWVVADIYNGGSYGQAKPSATVSADGTIHVAWEGFDSTDNAKQNIRYSKSTDGGATWSAAIKLTSGNVYDQGTASITTNSSNSVYVAWAGQHSSSTTYYQIRTAVYSSGAWSTIYNITSATNNQFAPQLCDNYKTFTEPLWIWQDNQTASIKFRGVWTDTTSTQTIPSVSNATAESQLIASGDGTLKSSGTSLKRYAGFVSKKSKGWT